jgi:hypothetical protein
VTGSSFAPLPRAMLSLGGVVGGAPPARPARLRCNRGCRQEPQQPPSDLHQWYKENPIFIYVGLILSVYKVLDENPYLAIVLT